MTKRAKRPPVDRRATKRLKAHGGRPSELCDRCSKIASGSNNIQVKAGSGIEIAQVDESLDHLRASPCRFCILLASITPPELAGANRSIYAFSANDIYAHARFSVLQRAGVSDSVLLGVLPASGQRTKKRPHDFIGVMNDGVSEIQIGPQKIESDEIDYSKIKSWMTFCESKHKGLCLRPRPKNPPMLQVLQVDGATEKPVLAPDNCEYVALSYVWGPPTAGDNQEFSMVVKDSLKVARELGYKYLWVDKHCIDQDNADIKLEQIKSMNLVYGNARLTIIAGAGEDSAYGLPGVGPRQRILQEYFSANETLFIRTFPHASETLNATKWSTRGWTFQEGILSNRRLIFTDQQVAFQCNGMHCSEAIYWPFELMHARSQRMFPQNVPGSLFSSTLGRKFLNPHKPYLSLSKQIVEYSRRSLTQQSDRLNAILGILGEWETRAEPIYHAWGVPVIQRFSIHSTVTRWDIMLGGWLHQEPCSRQPEFPSWSWAGWSGPMLDTKLWRMGSGNLFTTTLEKDSNAKASELVSLSRFTTKHSAYQNYSMGSPFLQLEVQMVEIAFTHVQWSVSEAWKRAYYTAVEDPSNPRDNAFKDGIYAKIPHRGYTELSYFYADDKDLDASTLHEQLMQAFVCEIVQYSTDTVLIVIAPRQDHFERIGYVHCLVGSVDPHPDIAYCKEDGKLTKTRPAEPIGTNVDDVPRLMDGAKTTHIRLG